MNQSNINTGNRQKSPKVLPLSHYLTQSQAGWLQMVTHMPNGLFDILCFFLLPQLFALEYHQFYPLYVIEKNSGKKTY